MMQACKNCGILENTHHKLSQTCIFCGRPRHWDVEPLGTLTGPCELYEVFTGTMSCNSRAVKINGQALMLGDQIVYIDCNNILYIMKEKS